MAANHIPSEIGFVARRLSMDSTALEKAPTQGIAKSAGAVLRWVSGFRIPQERSDPRISRPWEQGVNHRNEPQP